MRLHTFVICAYKESPYLEECIQSLMNQDIQSEMLMVTSTPNKHISGLADKYQIPLYINEGEKGITQDWNFAYRMAKTPLVTIAHQDDVYLSGYAKKIILMIREAKLPLIAFTDYAELRNQKPVIRNQLLGIKRMLLFPLRFSMLQNSRFIRRRVLSLGNPICCPAVTFYKKNLPKEVFKHGFRSDEDWEAWEELSKLKGTFCYSKEILMYHRIHENSETSSILSDNIRTKEDFVMFCKFWPKWIAKILTKIYSLSEKSNNL